MKAHGIRIMTALAVATLLAIYSGCMLPAPKRKPKPVGDLPGRPERAPRYEHDGFIIARASLHNHTVYSDGCRTPEDLLALARSQGISVLSYNDHREGKVCYGTYFCGDVGGVSSHGYDKYYDHLRQIQETARSQGMIALKGIEVSSPYFRNHGRFPHLVFMGRASHFTVFGVEDPAIFENMPVRDNVPLTPETDHDDGPLREFVKYLDDHGAIVNCAHPEWAPDGWDGPVHTLNIPPIYNVFLPGLNSFSALPESFEVVPRPGGNWDMALASYLAGMRDRPLWTLGDADYHCSGSLANATTLLYMREYSEAEVYRCMREGRMVALMGDAYQDVYVSEWRVGDCCSGGRSVMLGEQVRLSGAPTVRFSLSKNIPGSRTVLVRNGVVVKSVAGSELTFVDEDLGQRREPAYYRVEVTGGVDSGVPWKPVGDSESLMFVNPIFVRFN